MSILISVLTDLTQLGPNFLQAICLLSISSTYTETICEGDEGRKRILHPLIKGSPIVNTLKITRKSPLNFIILRLHCEKYILLE